MEQMDENKPVVLSPEGLAKLQEELDYLRNVKRKEVAERLKEARSYGDLSENSEYDDARNEQAFVEGRITMLENTLRNAVVIDEEAANAHAGEVRLGSSVVLRDLEYGDLLEYTLVGTVEADPAKNKISNESPVGKAIIGKKKGSVVEVEAPVGSIKYEIVDVK
jgi:transcription elongation factor GreA